MKGLEIFFPPFDTIVCDPELEMFFNYAKKVDPEKVNVERFIGEGYAVVIEKYMPPKSALFLQDKNIVAVYLNGRLSFNKAKIKNLETLFAGFLKSKMK